MFSGAFRLGRVCAHGAMMFACPAATGWEACFSAGWEEACEWPEDENRKRDEREEAPH